MKLKDAKVRYVEKEEKPKNKASRASLYSEGYKGEYYNLSLDKLSPFKGQARKFFDKESIEQLAATIKEHGIRQPLTVLPDEENPGHYEIVSGERRYRAAKELNLTSVPCMIFQDRARAEEVALIENIQRKDLHPIELMNGYTSLLDKGICTSMQDIADKLGMSKSSVVDIMNLRNLPQETQDLLLEKQIKSRDFLRSLCKSPAEMHESMIDKIDAKNSDDKVKKNKKVIHTKTKVLNIVYDQNMFMVENNRIRDLSSPQRDEIKDLLISILGELR